MFETEVHNISIIVRSVGSIIVCASCMFGIPQQSWAGNKFVAWCPVEEVIFTC